MIGVIEVREFYFCSNADRQECGNKSQILLPYLSSDRGIWFRKRALQIYNCQRRFGFQNVSSRDNLIALGHDRSSTRFRQLHSSLDDRISQARKGERGKNSVQQN